MKLGKVLAGALAIAVARRYADQCRLLKLVAIAHDFGGWARAQKIPFADGGVFDQIMMENRR